MFNKEIEYYQPIKPISGKDVSMHKDQQIIFYEDNSSRSGFEYFYH